MHAPLSVIHTDIQVFEKAILVTNDKSFIPEGWGTFPKELMPVNLWMEAEDARIRPPLSIGLDSKTSLKI